MAAATTTAVGQEPGCPPGSTQRGCGDPESVPCALQAGERPDIELWWPDGETGAINLVVRGLHSTRSRKGRGQIISPYYFRIDDFDPFT
jgi:hypothetical protein